MYLTLDQLKGWLLPESLRADYKFDNLISAISEGVAGAFDRFSNRTLGYTVGAQDIYRANLDTFVLSCYPVVSLTAVDYRGDLTSGWVSQTVNDVVSVWDPTSGTVQLQSALGTNTGQVRITHTGGYWYFSATYPAMPVGATALPNDLLSAYRLQVERIWKSRDRMGLSIADPKPAEVATIDFDPITLDILRRHIRHTML